MRRTTPLRADPDKARAARARAVEAYQRRRRERLRESGARPRRAPRRKPRLSARLLDAERAGREAWAKRTQAGGCQACGRDDCGPIHGHHAITQQHLKQLCLTQRLGMEGRVAVLWDLRNHMRVGERCHMNHHSRARPISRAAVLAACPALPQLLAELNGEWMLDREYPR
jgi:hypothetical protein